MTFHGTIRNLDVGNALLKAEQIKSLRTKRAAGQQDAERQAAIAGLAPAAVGGNQDAIGQIAGLDPDAARKFQELAAGMTEAQKAETAQQVEIGARAFALLESAPPQQRASLYPRVIQGLKAKGIDLDDAPPQYDPLYSRQQINEARDIEAILKAPPEPKAVQPINLKFPDGRVQAFDPRDPKLKEALAQPGVIRFGVQDTVEGATRPPSGNRVDELKGELSILTRGRSRLAVLKQSITEKRSRAGIAGSLSRFIQEGIGMATDLAGIGIDVPGFNREVVQQVAEDINSGRTAEEVGGLFDEEIPRNDTFVNGLAYTLAKARKGPGRLNTDDVKRALPDVQITGLKSVDSVLAKLDAVDQELAAAEADLNKRIGTNSTGGLPKFKVSPDGNLIRIE